MTADAAWLVRHIRLLRGSYQRWTGKALFEPDLGDEDAVKFLDLAPYAVVSHGTQPDPLFNYGNLQALQLFEMDFEKFTTLPSRLSAEQPLQTERERLLKRVGKNGYIDDYNGIRISSSGKRFMIQDATVWELRDEAEKPYGQAALIRRWKYL